MIRTRVRTLDFQGWARALVGHVEAALEQTARFVPLDVSTRIYAEQTPSGTNQQSNTPAVQARKLKTLGHAVPLLASGRLADPSGYTVDRVAGGFRVRPPVGRAQVIGYLREHGYQLFEISQEILDRLDDELGQAIDRAEDDIARYTTTRDY